MRLRAAIVLLLCVASQPALAQTADTPLMGSQATAEQPAAGETTELARMLVLGDAVGGGLGAGLERMTQAGGRFDVSIRFNEESGLARPDVYDWAETLPKILETNSYDTVVVLMGANDRQMIRAGNLRHGFNTPDWIAAYKAQVDKLLDQLEASGAKVYWVAIPPMADPQYDADLKVIAGLQRERVEARDFAYLDFSAQFSNPDGSYTDTGADETGSIRKLRGKDGISFFKAGNNKLAQLVLQAIESGKHDRPAPRAVVTVAEPVAPPEKRNVPLFGQSLLLGGTLTVEPVDIRVDALVVAGAGIMPSTAFQAIRDLTVAGTGAEKLLRRGEVAAAPTGRADDFSVPPEAKSD
jgi:uncharacterized protein